MNKQLYLVIDIESLGLHGPAFSAGYVVVDEEGNELESGIKVCDISKYVKPPTILADVGEINPNIINELNAEHLSEDDMMLLIPAGEGTIFKLHNYSQIDLDWINENVIPNLPEVNCESLAELRDWFWEIWIKWKSEGAYMVSDCAWPVETNFLSDCVKNSNDRNWTGPYPLIDVSSILLSIGKDPVGNYGRKDNELPEHNPLNDARQSARVLIKNLKELETYKEFKSFLETEQERLKKEAEEYTLNKEVINE